MARQGWFGTARRMLVVSAIALLLSGCAQAIRGHPEPAAQLEDAPATTTPPTAAPPTAAPPTAASPTAAPPATSLTAAPASTTSVQQTVTIDGIEYSGTKLAVTLVKIVDPVTAVDAPADDGWRYVGLQLRIKNVGSTAYQDAPSLEIAVTDQQHQQYLIAPVDRISAGPLLPDGLNVAVGDSVVGFAAVMLPQRSKVAKVAYSSGAGGQIAYWTIT